MKIALMTIMLFLAASGLQAQDLKLTATVNKTTVGIDESFTYQLEISAPVKNLPDPDLPDFSNFAVLSGPNVSTSFQIINFDMSASKTYSFVLTPRAVGKFEIPPATVQYEGKSYRSNAITITVTRTATTQPQTPQSSGNTQDSDRDLSGSLFLKAVPSKTSVFVNEQVNVSYKIYFRVNIRNPEYLRMPETVGFWVEEYPIKGDIPITQETVNGIQYNVAEVKKMALFPTKSGMLNITPLQLRVHVQVQDRRRDPFNVFDNFFDSPFGRMVSKELTSNEITVNVKPLPEEGKPENFSGLVGDFRLFSDLDKPQAPANEAISLTLKIHGTGNLKVLNEIPVEAPPSFEIYDPKIKDEVDKSGTYLSSSKEFEYILIPRVAGDFRIKPIEISFFDPFQRRYKTLRSREFQIKVSKGKETAGNLAGSYLSKEDVKLLGKDINFIKEDPPNFVPVDYAPYKSVRFILALLLPAVAAVGAYGYRNHLDRVSTDLEYARKRKAHKQARKLLRQANTYLKNGELAEFYGEVSKALIGYVADKTNTSAAGLIREEVEKIMLSRNVDPELMGQYFRCLDDADFRRFAPGQHFAREAESFYQQAEKILVKLEKHF